MPRRPPHHLACLACGLSLLVGQTASSQTASSQPTIAQALALSPMQKDVSYDRPTSAEAAKCSIQAEDSKGTTGWTVRGPAGETLRRFLDTNGDKKVDRWCYYQNGIEVYRDVDANFNGKADQYRWLGTAGTRWGLDANEDGRIDQWRSISAEEVTAELVAAIRDRDAARFGRLVLTPTELKTLGLGTKMQEALYQKTRQAAGNFSKQVARQPVVARDSKWIDFGGLQPGVVPAGTNGSTKDVVVYENVVAMIETNGKHGQLQVGTLIRVGDKWRVVDVPTGLSPGTDDAVAGFFFQASHSAPSATVPDMGEGISREIQDLVTALEENDKQLARTTSAKDLARLHAQRADLLSKLAQGSEGEDRDVWMRQLADAISAAVQSGAYPAGTERLEKLYEQVRQGSFSSNLVGYVKFRYMSSAYTTSLQDPKADFAKIQESWLKSLEKFVDDFAKSNDAAEAMLQLAIAQEFAGEEDQARRWYQRIVTDFPSNSIAGKARGAIRRIDSVGKSIPIRGRSIQGKTLDLASYRGKLVLVHYWATWCEPCKQDIDTLKHLQASYGRNGFSLIGISLDSQPQELSSYLRSKHISWPQIYEPGGLDSRLATEMGVFTLPVMLLVDERGQVINRNIHVSELEAELEKRAK